MWKVLNQCSGNSMEPLMSGKVGKAVQLLTGSHRRRSMQRDQHITERGT